MTEVTAGQVKAAAQWLRATAVELDTELQQSLGAGWYSAGSHAEEDANHDKDTIESMLAQVNLYLMAALDHSVTLAGWGEGAVAGVETPAFSPWSVARSILEACGNAAWLVEPGIDARTRLGRALTIQRSDASSRFLVKHESQTRIQQIDATAATHGFQLTTPDRGAPFFGTRIPAMTDRIKAIAPTAYGSKYDLYGLLSAVSHSEPWAVQSIGYEGERQGSDLALRKRVSPEYLILTIVVGQEALATSAQFNGAYRGWRKE